MLAVLAISLLTVRMWRLDEPYQMHFDEVYHPRTATEFLQDWRYGLSHDIYEWTHPHLAKYAMALGLVAFGEDRVGGDEPSSASPSWTRPIEPRRDDGLDASAIEGDRLWVATGSEVRAYDLATRELAGDAVGPRRRRARRTTDGEHVAVRGHCAPARSGSSTRARSIATPARAAVEVGVAGVHGRRRADRAPVPDAATATGIVAVLAARRRHDGPDGSTRRRHRRGAAVGARAAGPARRRPRSASCSDDRIAVATRRRASRSSTP